MKYQTQPRAEFSRPLVLDAVGQEDLVKELDATDEERSALAQRFGLLALGLLRAQLRISRREGAAILLVEGRIEAEVTQACIVTLDPVTSRLEESVEWRYSLDRAAVKAESGGRSGSRAVLVETEEADPPEPVGPEGIDLGETVAQQLAVALNPFPRSEGASLSDLDWAGRGGSEEGKGTFAALEALIRKP